MQCARLNLQERSKNKPLKTETPVVVDKPRRYCQKRMVNPDHEEDPRWLDLFDRFHVKMNYDQVLDVFNSAQAQHDNDDLFLTVQTLTFQGDVDQPLRPRTSFKYIKNPEHKHRMFVKQAVNNNDNEYSDDDRSSQQTSYYFDDYVKYLHNSDRSRPASGKSSIFFKGFGTKTKENKLTEIEAVQSSEPKKIRKFEPKIKSLSNKSKFPAADIKEAISELSDTITNTKITYKKTAKRKSLTISRIPSPETVQVIRVDVVCNRSSSDYEDDKTDDSIDFEEPMEPIDIKKDRFASKYLLKNTVRSLNENLTGGAKVTLLCKTFKLSDRSTPTKLNTIKDLKKTQKHTTKNDKRVKHRK